MKCVTLSLLVIAAALAQDQTGSIEGVVIDAASKLPVRNATVSIFFTDAVRGRAPSQGPQNAVTDNRGAFAFENLLAGRYQLTVMQQDYPQSRTGPARKTVQVTAGQTSPAVTGS